VSFWFAIGRFIPQMHMFGAPAMNATVVIGFQPITLLISSIKKAFAPFAPWSAYGRN